MSRIHNTSGSTTTLARLLQLTTGNTGWLAEGARPIQRPKWGSGNFAARVGIQHGGDEPLAHSGSFHVIDMDAPEGDLYSHTLTGNVGFGQEMSDGNFLLGISRGLCIIDPVTGSLRQTRFTVDGNVSSPEMAINDGHVFADATGTPIGLLFTTKSKDFGCAGGNQGRIYFLRFSDQKLFLLYDGLVCVNTPVVRCKANGFDLFVVETRHGKIYRTNFDPFANEAFRMVDPVSELKVFVDFAANGWTGFPDGQWLSGDVLVGTVFNPGSDANGLGKDFGDTSVGIIRALNVITGEVVHTWQVPGSCRVTCSAPAMTKSGPVLLITTADEGMGAQQHALNPNRGNLFVAELPDGLRASNFTQVPGNDPVSNFTLIPSQVFA